jgi:hypothetical protein
MEAAPADALAAAGAALDAALEEAAAAGGAGGAGGGEGEGGASDTTVHILLHTDVHGGAPGLACPAPGCGRVFKTSQTLRLHLRSHPPGAAGGGAVPAGAAPRRGRFHCCAPDCPYGAGGKSLASLKSAVNHYHQTHSQKGLACAVAGCAQRFAKRSALNRHVKNAHSAHACACGKRLCSKAALRKHISTWETSAPGVHAEVAEEPAGAEGAEEAGADAEEEAEAVEGEAAGGGAIAAFATAGDAAAE